MAARNGSSLRAAPAAARARSGERTPAGRPRANGRMRAAPADASAPELPFVERVDTSFLESLLGYNARRASLAVIEVFLQKMAPYGMRPVDFSVMSLVVHNPGITSRQLCTSLGILPPNLVSLVGSLESRGLLERKPHPRDGRATGLHPTPAGRKLMKNAERTATQLESQAASGLTASELQTLLRLLRKVYRPD